MYLTTFATFLVIDHLSSVFFYIMNYFSYYLIFLFSHNILKLYYLSFLLEPKSFIFSKLSQLKELVDMLKGAVRLWSLETALQLITIKIFADNISTFPFVY